MGTEYPSHHSQPAWSSTGLIAFKDNGIICVDASGSYMVDDSLAGIWTIDPRSGVRRQILVGMEWLNPAWSPDGHQLVVVGGSDIFVTRVDSVALTQLTFGAENFSPVWSTAGTIAYQSNQLTSFFGIWLMNDDGTGGHRVGSTPGVQPSWSPDGQRLLHLRAPGGDVFSTEVFVMNVDGNNPVRVSHNDATDLTPRYSPDGRRVVFSSQVQGEDVLPQIWMMNADGSNAVRLTSRGGIDPSWSPDGLQVVFSRDDWRRNTPDRGVLWIMRVLDRVESQLTRKWPQRCAQTIPGANATTRRGQH